MSAVATIEGAEGLEAVSVVAVPRSSYSSLPEEKPEEDVDAELDSFDEADWPFSPGRSVGEKRGYFLMNDSMEKAKYDVQSYV